MTDKLKKFVSEHRQEFDTQEPGTDLWKKIDAQMEVKNPSTISSNWLSTFKYLGFGASVLIVGVYFIANNLIHSAENEPATTRKDSLNSHSVRYLNSNQNRPELNTNETNTAKELTNLSDTKNKFHPDSYRDRTPAVSNPIEQPMPPSYDSLPNSAKTTNADPETSKPESVTSFLPKETVETSDNSAEKTENGPAGNTKKTGLYIPEEPQEMNSYAGTLYEGASFCSVLRAYKFPGKVSMYDGESKLGKHYKINVKTIRCSRLESMSNIKAVWLKGKTSKKITLSIKKGFKNIVLVKRDGRELRPEAISHYYPGRGAISGYAGLYFNLIFKDKVELILFFKDAEAGDKIVINGAIEAVVQGQP